MQTRFFEQLRNDRSRNVFGGAVLLLAGSTVACSNPGYRNEISPGQEGQYTLKRVPEEPAPAQSNTAPPAPQAGSVAAAPVASSAAPALPTDESLSQVESVWPKLSDSDKALLVQTAKHLASQK